MAENEKKCKPEEEPLKEIKFEKEYKEKTLLEKIRYVKENVTVEPVLAGLIIPLMLSKLAVQNLNLDKACRVKLNFGDAICDALIERKDGNGSSYEIEVQRVISAIESWKSIIQTAVPTVIIVFMGAWSDRTGNRKMCIILPLFGEVCVVISNILSTFFYYQVSVEATMALEALIPAVTGGGVMMFLGVFSYLSDISPKEALTFRVGLANLCMTAGVPIGTALSGILLKKLGFYGVFAISGSLNIITLAYALIYLKNNTKPNIDYSKKKEPIKCKDLVTLIKETVMMAFKKREGNCKKKILLVLLTISIVYGPNHGERLITYLFVRYRLKWDAFRFSIYSTYSIITHSIGALFSLTVFSKRLQFHDSMLCLISVFSKMVGSIYLAFVYTDRQMYTVPLIEILNATTFTSLRSMATKLVTADEAGKINSLFSLVETLAATAFDPTYTIMYSKTVHLFTGAVYLFSASMCVPAICLLLWFFITHRIETRKTKRDEVEI